MSVKSLWLSLPEQQRALITVALVGAALLIYPFADQALGLGTLYAVTDSMIYVLLALGLNIVIGYAGLLDLGYAAFFAIGAYTMGLFNSPLMGFEWGFWNVIWLSAVVSAAFGVMIGAPTLRVRGDYLAIITLAFGEIIPVAIRNLGDITIQIGDWQPVYRLNLTGGENGVNPIGQPHLFGVPFETSVIPWYFLILIIGAVSVWAMNRLRRSRLGRAWMAIREDETAATCMGVDAVKSKLLAFALGATFSGFAGSVYAAKLQAITPGASSMSLDGSVNIRDLESQYHIVLPRDEGFETLAGFMLARLQKIPVTHDNFEYQGRRYTVAAMEGHRIDSVTIETIPQAPPTLPAPPET